jgi:GNAT superfamily N-acetyltransferase
MSLTTLHQSLGSREGQACRYQANVSPFAGLQSATDSGFADLGRLVAQGEVVGLCTAEPVSVPDGWQVVLARLVEQMICTELTRSPPAQAPEVLTERDVPEMLALTAATEPGPFLPQTPQMGRYYGIRSAGGELISMAGERAQLERFTEISAVCTAPAARGQGHAGSLVTFLAAQILAEGRTPFLHVKRENEARLLYERIGFRTRQAMNLTVVARQ